MNNGLHTKKTDSVLTAGKGRFPGIRDEGPVVGQVGRQMVPEWRERVFEVYELSTTCVIFDAQFYIMLTGCQQWAKTGINCPPPRRPGTPPPSPCTLFGYGISAVYTFRIRPRRHRRRVHFSDTLPLSPCALFGYGIAAVCTFRIHLLYALSGYSHRGGGGQRQQPPRILYRFSR